MRITKNYKPYKKEIFRLEEKYLTGSLKNLDDNALVLVAIDENDNLMGYLYYSKVLDEAEIISICVENEYRKKGIASSLWYELIQDKSINICFLDVKETNTIAQKFYTKIGFKEYGNRKGYYSDGSSAILMKWSR